MTLSLFLIAGESSGDRLGAALMAGVKQLHPDVIFHGIGGPLMQAEGLDSLFPMEELAVMGIAEVLPRLRHLFALKRQAAEAVVALAPDALITIDSPDFCLRVAKQVRETAPHIPNHALRGALGLGVASGARGQDGAARGPCAGAAALRATLYGGRGHDLRFRGPPGGERAGGDRGRSRRLPRPP